MNILITGANGFIGRHLVATLLAQTTAHIWGIDCMVSLQSHARYQHVLADLTRSNWTNQLPVSIDVIVHLAQSNRYRDFPEGVSDLWAVNVQSTLELLEWARQNQVKRMIFASTGNVYRPSLDVLDEDAPCFPTSLYAATKLSAEYLIHQYAQFFEGIIVRLFTIYGPQQQSMLIPAMMARVTAGAEITLARGKGIYLTPLYISDCVEMLQRLLSCDLPERVVTFNLAGSERLHLGAIVEKIAGGLKRQPCIRLTDHEPTALQGNNAKICHFLTYQPAMRFEDGLTRMLTGDQTI